MYYECCVCKSSRQDATLHHFPRTEKRLLKWLQLLNRDGVLVNSLSAEQLSKMFVCQKHFEKKFITPKLHLVGAAYPSLFTQDEITSGVPSNAENINPALEHNYSHQLHEDHTYCQSWDKNDERENKEVNPSTSGIKRKRTPFQELEPTKHDERDNIEVNQSISGIKRKRTTFQELEPTKHDERDNIEVNQSISGIKRKRTTFQELEPTKHDERDNIEVNQSISGIKRKRTTFQELEPTKHDERDNIEVNQSTSGIKRKRTTFQDLEPTKHENMNPALEHNYSHQLHEDHTYCQSRVKNDERENIEVNPSTSGSGIKRKGTPFQELEARKHGNRGQISTGCSLDERQQAISTVVSVAVEPTPSTSRMGTYQTSSNRPSVINQEAAEYEQLVQEPVTNLAKIPRAKGPKAYGRRRLVTKLSDLTPTCRKLYNEFKKSRRQADYSKRAKRALKFNKEKSFQKLTRHMNPYARRIMKMQINLCTKHKMGRRFTQEEKLIALSIMKQSPKCYRFLHKIFILPSRSTLNKMVAKLKIESGICPQVFNLMKKEIEEWDEKKKMCTVMFDEMSLEPGVTYDHHRDRINGFVELKERKNEFADHALVFMLRGAVHKWQQPVAFYFCQGATKTAELQNILTDVISAVVECGLNPIALVCDQGSAFQSALKTLSNQAAEGTVTISGVNMNIVFDPPHLIKGLRNNFLNKNIQQGGKLSRWSDIVDVYETDCLPTESRLLHKLNDQHVVPGKIKKMKVKNCVKVFSNTVYAALKFTAKFSQYADGRPVSETLQNTAETVLFFDQLFDSVNGAATYSKKGKPLRTAVTENSLHHEFWKESVEKLKKLKYVDGKGREKSVPTLKNFVTTLNSMMRLWKLFQTYNLKIMRPRYFNSDPIENFFGQVRSYNYRNNDPNCHCFISTFKSLLITRMIKFHNETFNCEDDPADQIINLKTLFDDDEEGNNIEQDHSHIDQNVMEQARRERLNVHSRAYTAGWVVKKTLGQLKNTCKTCQSDLTSEKSDIHLWVSQKEYTEAKDRLHYPSENVVRCFGAICKQTNEFLEKNPSKKKISQHIKSDIMSKNSFDFFKCTEHKEIFNYFVDLTIRFTIINWCNSINKILRGKDIIRILNRRLPAMQTKALAKYKKRIKNKSFNK